MDVARLAFRVLLRGHFEDPLRGAALQPSPLLKHLGALVLQRTHESAQPVPALREFPAEALAEDQRAEEEGVGYESVLYQAPELVHQALLDPQVRSLPLQSPLEGEGEGARVEEAPLGGRPLGEGESGVQQRLS